MPIHGHVCAYKYIYIELPDEKCFFSVINQQTTAYQGFGSVFAAILRLYILTRYSLGVKVRYQIKRGLAQWIIKHSNY